MMVKPIRTTRVVILAVAGLLLSGACALLPVAPIATADAISVSQVEKYGEEAQLVTVREATITLDDSWDVTWDDSDDTNVNFASADGSVQGLLVAGSTNAYNSNDPDKLLLSNFERTNAATLPAGYGVSSIQTVEHWRDGDAFFAIGEGSNTTLDVVTVLAIQGDQIATLTVVSDASSNGDGVHDDVVNSLTICGTKLDGTARFGLELLPADSEYAVSQTDDGAEVTLGKVQITIPSTSTIEESESYGTYVEFDGDVSGWIMAGTSPIYDSENSVAKLEQALVSFIPDALRDYGLDVQKSWRFDNAFFAVASLPEDMQTNAETYYVFTVKGDQVALLLVSSPKDGGALDVVNSMVIDGTHIKKYSPGSEETAILTDAPSVNEGSSANETPSVVQRKTNQTISFGPLSFELSSDYEGEKFSEDYGLWVSAQTKMMVLVMYLEDAGLPVTGATAPIVINSVAETIEETLGQTLLESDKDADTQIVTSDGTQVYVGVRVMIGEESVGMICIGVAQAPGGEIMALACIAPVDIDEGPGALSTASSEILYSISA